MQLEVDYQDLRNINALLIMELSIQQDKSPKLLELQMKVKILLDSCK